MPRPKKEIPSELKKNIKEALGELQLANQLTPLMFNRDFMAVLLSLNRAYKRGGLPFVNIGDITNLGSSQKLVDTLNLLIDYGLVEKSNSNYCLTEFGYSASNFAERFVKMINSDSEIARKNDLAGNISVIQDVDKKHKEYVSHEVKKTV